MVRGVDMDGDRLVIMVEFEDMMQQLQTLLRFRCVFFKWLNLYFNTLPSKLSWQMTINSTSLWSTALRDKYLHNHSSADWPSNRPVFGELFCDHQGMCVLGFMEN